MLLLAAEVGARGDLHRVHGLGAAGAVPVIIGACGLFPGRIGLALGVEGICLIDLLKLGIGPFRQIHVGQIGAVPVGMAADMVPVVLGSLGGAELAAHDAVFAVYQIDIAVIALLQHGIPALHGAGLVPVGGDLHGKALGEAGVRLEILVRRIAGIVRRRCGAEGAEAEDCQQQGQCFPHDVSHGVSPFHILYSFDSFIIQDRAAERKSVSRLCPCWAPPRFSPGICSDSPRPRCCSSLRSGERRRPGGRRRRS